MRSRIYKTTSPKKTKKYVPFILVGSLFYIALMASGMAVLAARSHTERGQLSSEGTESAKGFSRSLDLRTAAKDTYPSDQISIVQELGADQKISSKIFSFTVPKDGLTEYGLMTLPATPVPKNGFPTIILCHGYTNPSRYATEENYLEDMDFYSRHGFAVLKPDYRGQGLSYQQGEADSAYYSMAYNTDVMSLISALKKTKYIDRNNLNLWGHSMGAYIALRAAVLSPDIKNTILLSGAVASLNKMYLTYIPPSDINNINALRTRNNVFAKYGTPADNVVFWKYASPINLVKQIRSHLQINVGLLDQIVPPEFSADLDAALSKNHIPHDYYVYPDGEHSLETKKQQVWNRSLEVMRPKTPTTPSA